MTKRRRLVGKSDADFPVDQDTVNTAVGGLASLSAAQEISDVEDLSEYDLDSPQNEIKLTTDDGDTVLQIGMENESTSQYYVKKSDDDKNVYLVDSSAVEPFMGTLYDFAESGTFPSVTSSTITEVKVDKEDGYELTQDPDNLFWNVSDGKTSEKADTDKAGTVTSAIGSLAYDSFVDYNCTDDSKYGFDDPYAVITAKYTEEEAVEEDDSEEAEDADSETTADEDSDLLDPKSWTKERYPVLRTDESRGIYGPGHNSFTEDEEGNPVMVYHARTEAEIEGNPLYNPNRHAMLMKIRWDEKTGAPIFSYED